MGDAEALLFVTIIIRSSFFIHQNETEGSVLFSEAYTITKWEESARSTTITSFLVYPLQRLTTTDLESHDVKLSISQVWAGEY